MFKGEDDHSSSSRLKFLVKMDLFKVKSDVNTYIHLDLKGGPPKPDYLRKIWKILKNWGVTGVIIEWEDSFPYKDNLKALSNNIYTNDDVLEIIGDIQRTDLKIIPLVQSIGHLEFVLKHEEYASYREVPLYSSSMCPSHPNSVKLILEMFDQVISLHGRLEHFHIGADEVWHMGLCERCKERIEGEMSREDLFLEHIKKICETIKTKWPDITIIMWDDMLRSCDISLILGYQLNTLVEVMVWHYNSSDSFNLPRDIWMKYEQFGGIWTAGAFKGASGGSQLIPRIDLHVSNNQQWARTIQCIKSPVRGHVFTGWSRYDHFAAMCELLPNGLTSLGICLRVFNGDAFSQDVIKEVEKDLMPKRLKGKKPNKEEKMWHSNWQVVVLTAKLVQLRESTRGMLNSDQLQTWMNRWQILNNRVNPMQLVPMIPVLQRAVEDFNELEKEFQTNLIEIYKAPTITEWIATYLDLARSDVLKILSKAETIVQNAAKPTGKLSDMEF